MLIIKRYLILFLIPLCLTLSVWLSYQITYYLLRTNVASFSLSEEDIKVLQTVIKNIYLVSDIMKEYLDPAGKDKVALDQKKLSDYRILLFQIQRENHKLNDLGEGKLTESLRNIIKNFNSFLERIDTMMKFPSDKALTNAVCLDFINLLNTIIDFSKFHNLRYEFYLEKLIKDIKNKCKS